MIKYVSQCLMSSTSINAYHARMSHPSVYRPCHYCLLDASSIVFIEYFSLNLFIRSRLTWFIALNAQFFILSHQPDCARRKLDQLSQHLSTLDICTDRRDDLFIDFIHSWSDYVQLESDYHAHAYEQVRQRCEIKFHMAFEQHALGLDWHRLLYHRVHILYRLTCFQQLRTRKLSAEHRSILMWK
jgi:hypothetical protein